jgi:2-aminoadipate transaminase
MRRSTVREFMRYAQQPGMISFGGGLPAAELFPIAAFEHATKEVLAKRGGSALQYGETEGVAELRENIALEHKVAVENVLITSGAQQALDLIGRVLLDAEDRVAVENPTYLALLSSWRVHGPAFEPLRSDAEGLDIGSMNHGCKMLYVVPNFQNPQGTTLSLRRREQLAAYAKKENLIVVEDDPYGALRYEGEPLPSIFELSGRCNSSVVSVGTFSKVLSPGLRVGWAVAHPVLIEKLIQAKQSADLHTSTINQHLALELVKNGLLEKHVPVLCNEYRKRRDTMLHALRQHMPDGVSWTEPAGGMFLLMTLPEGINGAMLARAALNENVLVVPGADFHVVGGENTVRINFSNAKPELIQLGIARLAAVLRELLDSPPDENNRVSFSEVRG